MKDVQCYELFGGIALKIHTFSFSFFIFIFAVLFPLSRLRLGGFDVTDGCWMLCLLLGMEHCGKYVVIAGFT